MVYSLLRLTPIVLAALALLGPTAVLAAEARTHLVIGISQFPDNFNPNINTMAAKSYILNMARRPITTHDPDWKLICMLCTELPSLEKGTARYETTKDGKKGIAVTYTLRGDARWGDGTPVTTRDVLFTWEVGRHKLSGVANAELYRRIDRVDVKDAHTFTFHVNKRTCDYANIGDFELLPAHIDRENFAEPAEYRNRSAYETDTTNPGLWFGPYRVVEVVSGSHVVLEPNRTWWGKKPEFKRVVVKAIMNTAAMTSNLLAGGIDYVGGEVGLTLDQAVAFEKRHAKRFRFVYKQALVYEHIDLNLDNPILADRRVRRALIHAMDRGAISSQLFGGYQPVAHSNVNPLDTVYHPDVPKYSYDPARAKALLDAAGWTAIGNGIRHNAKGVRLQLLIMTTAGNKTRELVQQVLQSNLRQVGIDLRIRNEPARVYFGDTVTRRKFPALAMYAWLSAPGSVPRGQLHSDEVPTAANGWSGQNYPGYRSKEMDALIDDVETVCEANKNRALWNRLQAMYARELPALPLYFRAEAHIMPKWLKGVRPTGHQHASTLWIEEWSAAQ
jgi:peptide/nickel transport system substrate-binding protein